MSVTVELPESIEHQLQEEWGSRDLSRKALEGLITEAYRAEKLSTGQVAEALGLSVIETEAFLKERSVELNYTLEDLKDDRESLRKVLGE
jgi:predicted HTH domain antitoxin